MNTAAPVAELLKQGLLGVLLLLACAVIVYLYRGREVDRIKHMADLDAAQKAHTAGVDAAQKAHIAAVDAWQKARIEDSVKHHAELLDITRTAVAAVANATNAQLAVKESVVEIRETLADNNAALRDYVEEQRSSPPRRQRT